MTTWDEEAQKEFAEVYGRTVAAGTVKQGFAAVATRALEIAAALGGTMTAEQIRALWDMTARGTPTGNVRMREALDHISALGARVAALEEHRGLAKNEGLEEAARFHESSASAARANAWRLRDERKENLARRNDNIAVLHTAWARQIRAMKVGGKPPVRFPCSPTCIHDDALRPGHPERVKDQSAALSLMTEDRCTGCGTLIAEHPLKPECGAIQEDGIDLLSPRVAYEQGSEEMRSTCLTAGDDVLIRFGYGRKGEPLREALKRALEGVAP